MLFSSLSMTVSPTLSTSLRSLEFWTFLFGILMVHQIFPTDLDLFKLAFLYRWHLCPSIIFSEILLFLTILSPSGFVKKILLSFIIFKVLFTSSSYFLTYLCIYDSFPVRLGMTFMIHNFISTTLIVHFFFFTKANCFWKWVIEGNISTSSQ